MLPPLLTPSSRRSTRSSERSSDLLTARLGTGWACIQWHANVTAADASTTRPLLGPGDPERAFARRGRYNQTLHQGGSRPVHAGTSIAPRRPEVLGGYCRFGYATAPGFVSIHSVSSSMVHPPREYDVRSSRHDQGRGLPASGLGPRKARFRSLGEQGGSIDSPPLRSADVPTAVHAWRSRPRNSASWRSPAT